MASFPDSFSRSSLISDSDVFASGGSPAAIGQRGFGSSLFPDTEMSIQSELRAYREHPREMERVSRLFGLMARSGPRALDVGARDGHLSLLLAERFERVVALDLNLPHIDHPRVDCVIGDAAQLGYPDRSFHTVVCAEVLEHIPPALLPQVCRELVRVADHHVVIGVPFRQDLRVACCTCGTCGTVNPPWGHVNSFDLQKLAGLMQGMVPVAVDYVGRTRAVTNFLSAGLLRFAGNPYGTYDQHEPCVNCGERLLPPKPRNLPQKVATRLAHWCTVAQTALTPWRGNWMHVRFEHPPVPGLAPSPSERGKGSAPLLRPALTTASPPGTAD